MWNLFSRTKDFTVSSFTGCHFKLRHRKRQPFLSERYFRQNDFRTPRWLSTIFCMSKLRYDLEFQSRDRWSLSNYDAIEITSKWFYASSVTIPYVQNLTLTLKLRTALFSWLVWALFLAMRKVTTLSGGFPLQGWWSEKSCHLYLNSLPCHPSPLLGRAVTNFFSHCWCK